MLTALIKSTNIEQIYAVVLCLLEVVVNLTLLFFWPTHLGRIQSTPKSQSVVLNSFTAVDYCDSVECNSRISPGSKCQSKFFEPLGHVTDPLSSNHNL